MWMCVYVENIGMASWMGIWFVRPYVHVYMLGKSVEFMCP